MIPQSEGQATLASRTSRGKVSGWVVRATVRSYGCFTADELFDVAVPDAVQAVLEVGLRLEATDEVIQVVQSLSQPELDRLGLEPGQIARRA